MKGRTEIQIGLVIAGLIVWGYGQRQDDPWLRWAGIAFFGVATAMRFLKRRSSGGGRDDDDETTGSRGRST